MSRLIPLKKIGENVCRALAEKLEIPTKRLTVLVTSGLGVYIPNEEGDFPEGRSVVKLRFYTSHYPQLSTHQKENLYAAISQVISRPDMLNIEPKDMSIDLLPVSSLLH